MTQKSLLNFFQIQINKKVPCQEKENCSSPGSSNSIDSVAVKTAKRPRRILDSDDEDDESVVPKKMAPENFIESCTAMIETNVPLRNSLPRKKFARFGTTSDNTSVQCKTEHEIVTKNDKTSEIGGSNCGPRTKEALCETSNVTQVEMNEAAREATTNLPKQEAVTQVERNEAASEAKTNLPKQEQQWNSFFKKESKKSATSIDSACDYNPGKVNYDPVKDACWSSQKSVPYLALAKTFELIESLSSRLQIIDTLANLLRSVMALTPNDLYVCMALSLNQLAPAYQGVELGVGETVLAKALAQATGSTLAKVRLEAQSCGDLGLVAERLRSRQRLMSTPNALSARDVHSALLEISGLSGNSAQGRKVVRIQSLLVACRLCEARYLVRALAGKLRIGLAEQSALCALGRATAFHEGIAPEKATLAVRTAFCECPDMARLCAALSQPEGGSVQLSKLCHMQPRVPVKPMLAHPTRGVAEVLKRFADSQFVCEWKYDGERAQLHVEEVDGVVHVCVFSRNSENNTSKYPDLVERMRDVAADSHVTSCILDTEAVAWDAATNSILPFQVLSTRKRKDAEADSIKVQVIIFAFDLLFLNGRSLVREPLSVRRELLRNTFKEKPGAFQFATSLVSSDTESIGEFLEESLRGNCEGLMVKSLDKNASYEIARRSHSWLKLKKDYLESVGDTLDLVVIGAYHGAGKRVGRYGGFLLACYEPDSESYQSICKLGTGFSDEALQEATTRLQSHVIPRAKSYYQVTAEPEVWLDAVEVWEIRCADLSLSPVHLAAAGLVPDGAGRGISLRFPRFLRRREDKRPEEATNAAQIAQLYLSQDQVRNAASGAEQPPAVGEVDEQDEFY